MNQKNGFVKIILIVFVVALAGIAGYFVFTPGFTTRPQNSQSVPDPQIALAPYVDAEAVVSSLFLDDLYSDCNAPEVCPRDRMTLKMSKVDRTGDPNNVINLNVGDQIEFHLKYSARAAKLRPDILPVCRQGEVFRLGSCFAENCQHPECTASSPNYTEKPAEIESSYIVYHLPQREDEISDKILPGLETSTRIKMRVRQSDLLSKEIGVYEVMLQQPSGGGPIVEKNLPYCSKNEDCVSVVEVFPQCNHYCIGDECNGIGKELCRVVSKHSQEYKERKYLQCIWSKPCTKPIFIECIHNKCVAD